MASNDFVISTNLIVFGMSTFTGGQTFDGQAIIDIDSTEALLVREDGDTGDVFIVNTVTASATLPHANSFISLGPNPAASGDIRFANTRFIAWRNMNNNGDVQALAVDEDDFLNIGSAAALRSRILSPRLDLLSGANLLWPAEDGDIGASGATRPENVHVKSTVVIGDDESAGFGLTIGDNSQGHSPLWIVGSFTSDGSQSVFSAVSAWNMNLTGFAGETDALAGLHVNNSITTQGNSDTITDVAQVIIFEPTITVGSGDTVTNASVLVLLGSPTEGTNNFSIRSTGAGAALFGGLQLSIGQQTLDDFAQFIIRGNFTSGGSSFIASKMDVTGGLIGASGDVDIATAFFRNNITTQAVAEVITDVSQVVINDPVITLGAGSSVTNAQSLKINGSPTEGTNNFAIRSVGAAPSLFIGTQFVVGQSAVDVNWQFLLAGSFTTGTAGEAAKLRVEGGLIGAPGTTTALFGANFDTTITTQTATENITDIAQVRIDEPSIADNLTGDITHASILLLTSSTVLEEGVNNWGIRALGAAPSVFQAAQFIIGRTTVDDWLGVIIGGQFTSGGGNTLAARVRTEGGMTGAPGDTSLLTGMWLDVSVATQIASETIGSISQIRIDEPAITDNLTGGGLITNAQTLEITGSPTEGVNNYALRSLGPAPTLFMGLQFVIGDFAVDDFHQVLISGAFISGGTSDRVAKFRIEGNMTGAAGDTGTHNGAYFDATMITQTATENIADMSQVRIDEPTIVDNLTGDITKAHTLFLVGSPTEGELNYALRSTGPAPSLFQGLQFVIGDFAEDDFWQVLISGSFTSGGSSNESAKLRIEGALTGADGDTAGMVGSYFDATFVTQTAVENIANISQCRFDGANITDNLTGDITNAQTLFITASPTAGEANWTIRSTGIAPSIFQGLQLAIGRTTLEDWHQVVVSGAFTSGGSSTEADKFKVESSLTGAPGDTAALFGAFFGASIVTQTATESIADIAQVKIVDPSITDNLTGSITNASTLFLSGSPTEGVNNFALRSTGPARTMFHGLPFSIGTNVVQDVWQVQIRGNFTSGGASNRAAKFEIEESVIGVSGDTVFLGGADFAARVTTQTAAEVVADVFQVRINEPVITVGAGSSITRASTLLVVSAPTEGVDNYALRVATGATFLGGELEHTGSTLGFFGTSPTTQPAAYTRNATIVEDRTLLASASATALNNNNVLAALIADLQSLGVIG